MRNYKVASLDAMFTLPASLDEVTFGQAIQIVTLADPIRPIDVLSILNDNPLELQKCDAGIIAELYERVRFVEDIVSLMFGPVPGSIDGVVIQADASKNSVGHYLSLERWVEQLIREGADDNPFSWFVPMMAAYVGPQLLGKPYTDVWPVETPFEWKGKTSVDYAIHRRKQEEAGIDYSSTDEFVLRVIDLPCTDAMPLAYALYKSMRGAEFEKSEEQVVEVPDSAEIVESSTERRTRIQRLISSIRSPFRSSNHSSRLN